MPLDFTKPVVTGAYATDILPPIVDSQKALAQWLDPVAAGTLTGTPTGAMRRVDSTSALERWSGSAWVAAAINGVILAGANVGVGATPIQKFQVNTATDRNVGVQSASIISGGIALKAYNDAGSAQVGLEFGGLSFGWEIAGTQRLGLTTSGLTSTVPVVLPQGSASAPGLAFGGDLNNGWWSPAADRQAWSTGGVERMSLDGTSLLLGTTTGTSARLAVTAAAASGAASVSAIFGQGAAGVVGTESRVHITAGEGTARGTYISAINTGGANNAHDLVFATSASASAPVERARVTNFGINIGNTDGATPLEVTTSSGARGITIRGRSADNISGLDFYSNDGATSYGYIQGRVNGDIRYGARTDSGFHAFYTGATLTERLRVDNSGAKVTGDLETVGTVFGGSGSGGIAFQSRDGGGTLGSLRLVNGSTIRSGYTAFYAANGVRQGYIGYSLSTGASDTGTLNYVGGNHDFLGTVDLSAAGALRVNSLITRFESAEQTVPSATNTMSIAHGGTRVPDLFQVFLRCKTAELGYSVGAEVLIKDDMGDGNRGHQLQADATNVVWRYLPGGGATVPQLRNASNAIAAITPGNWRAVFKAHWL